jgi:hypothetical protein
MRHSISSTGIVKQHDFDAQATTASISDNENTNTANEQEEITMKKLRTITG